MRVKAKDHFSKSNGTFDDYAEKALDNLESIQCPTSEDHFLMARLIDLNAHEGRINNVHVLNNVINRYLNSTDDYESTDWFEIDQMENFIERHMDILAGNPHYNAFLESALSKRPKKVAVGLEQVKESAENKSSAFSLYVEENKERTSDDQNVHDSAVNVHLRKTLQHLKATTPSLSPTDLNRTITHIRDHLRFHLPNEKRKLAMSALNAMTSNGKYNWTLEIDEKELVGLVWSRGELQMNVSRKATLREAFVQSLVEMASPDGHSVVCSNGRCARLLESLVLTDFDTNSISGAMTVEQIRNDAFTESNKILQRMITVHSTNKVDRKLRDVARSYIDPSLRTEKESEEKFKTMVKSKIDTYLQSQYKDRLSENGFQQLQNHCLQTIDSL